MEDMNLYIFGVITLVILVGTLPLIIKSVKLMKDSLSTMQQDADLMAIGTEAEAVVQAVTETNTTYNQNPQVILDLKVFKENGETFTTRVKTIVPTVNLPQYKAGSKVMVRYVEENGEKRVAVLGAYRLNK
ncbi:hypothetical protein [Paenibacillus senegalensis]|uniref:hypothetical protein n=1 Tax=Paenibacillus senegalensis TaxID=1465766 RepID=UPI000288E329|nr:hypothetical protein [Paenibacillus senegalensis]